MGGSAGVKRMDGTCMHRHILLNMHNLSMGEKQESFVQRMATGVCGAACESGQQVHISHFTDRHVYECDIHGHSNQSSSVAERQNKMDRGAS